MGIWYSTEPSRVSMALRVDWLLAVYGAAEGLKACRAVAVVRKAAAGSVLVHEARAVSM